MSVIRSGRGTPPSPRPRCARSLFKYILGSGRTGYLSHSRLPSYSNRASSIATTLPTLPLQQGVCISNFPSLSSPHPLLQYPAVASSLVLHRRFASELMQTCAVSEKGCIHITEPQTSSHNFSKTSTPHLSREIHFKDCIDSDCIERCAISNCSILIFHLILISSQNKSK